jgi:spoIIIJ-associated protein
MASIEIVASDVESAIEQGLRQLGLMRAEVKIEILEEGSRGVLGLGSRQCKVRLTPWDDIDAADDDATDDDDVEEAQDVDLADDGEDVDEDAVEEYDEDDEQDEQGEEDEEEPAPVIEGEGLAVEIVQTILENMGFRRAQAYGRSLLPMDDADQPSIIVEIEVEDRDEEAFLAHNAEGLNALQMLVQTMWSHRTKSNVRVNVDVNGYKAQKQEKIVSMARRMAERVIESGRAVTLEPMNGADRRIVHMTLREFPGVYTESSGEGASRRVHIKPNAA